MKITKTAVSIFLLAFLVGYASVRPTEQIPAKMSVKIETISTAPSAARKVERDIIEEIKFSEIDESKFKIKLLETGEGFHGDEVIAKSGETWLGLFKDGETHFLRRAKINIRRINDPIVDGEDTKLKSGKNVSAAGAKEQPLFMLKNVPELKTGEVKTFFRGFTFDEINNSLEERRLTDLEKGFVQEYESGGEKYTLRVKEAVNRNGEEVLALILENGETRQILHSIRSESSASLGTLYWAGDLDGDGKPDFYMELFRHENAVHRNLFLSSEAEKVKLVKTAAVFVTTGC